MYAARGSIDGERFDVTRLVKRRLRDADVLADRDVQIAEWHARGWSQQRIGLMLRIDRTLVCRRLAMLPGPVLRAVQAGVARYPDALPGDVRDRLREAVLEMREHERRRKREAG